MMMVRILSGLAAAAAVVFLPVVLDPSGHGLPGWAAVSGIGVIALTACSFLYLAMVAPRLRRHPDERYYAGGLLLIPCIGAIAMLATARDIVMLASSGLLLAVTVLLLLGVLFPDALGEERRMRRRVLG